MQHRIRGHLGMMTHHRCWRLVRVRQDVKRGDVELPRLGQRLLDIRAEVIRGRGFQVRSVCRRCRVVAVA